MPQVPRRYLPPAPACGPDLMYKCSSWPYKLVFCSLSSWLGLNNLIKTPLGSCPCFLFVSTFPFQPPPHPPSPPPPASHLFTFFLTAWPQAPCLLDSVCQFSWMFSSPDIMNEHSSPEGTPQALPHVEILTSGMGGLILFFKEMFVIFFLFKIKNKIHSLWKKLENSERISKEKLKYYPLSQHQGKPLFLTGCLWT